MGDEACKEICESVQTIKNVKVLNLSKNNITDVGALYISDLIYNQQSIIVSLLIHWNQIRGKGAIALAKALRKNQSLQIFDASFNSFGSS